MHWTTLPALAAALLMACQPGQRERAGDESAGTAETGMSGDTASTGTPTGTGEARLGGIFSRLELANSAEIQLATLATEQAASPEVKRLAERLVREHTRNRDELEALAGKLNVNVLPPAGGNTARDTSGVLVLQGLEGTAFDSAFVAGQIEAHQVNLDAIRNQLLPAADEPEVRQYLEKTRTAMEQHLADLETLQGRLRGG